MAKEEFDFNALKELKFNDYKKEYCKPARIKKAKGGLVLVKFDLKAKKKGCVFLPFNKLEEAKVAFKALKDDKSIHLVKRTALVGVKNGKGENGPEVTLEVLKGGLTADMIKSEADELFNNTIKMALNVTGVSEDDDVSLETSTDDEDKTTNKEDKEAKKAKRAEKRKQMKAGIDKMHAAKDKVSKDKLNANVQKYEDALATLIKEAEEDGSISEEEQKGIDELTNALNELKTAIAERDDTPKLTPERRQKINANMEKISARLEAITKKLGV